MSVVIGAGMGGLTAAGALADRFDQVIVLERDTLPSQPAYRAGTPQSRHVHALLLSGLLIYAATGGHDDAEGRRHPAGRALQDRRALGCGAAGAGEVRQYQWDVLSPLRFALEKLFGLGTRFLRAR